MGIESTSVSDTDSAVSYFLIRVKGSFMLRDSDPNYPAIEVVHQTLCETYAEPIGG